MTVLTQDEVRELAGVKGQTAPVTSLYLDVDGRRYPRPQAVEQSLAALLRRARQRGPLDPSVEADLERIQAHVHAGVDRSHVRGLAFFACSAQGLWRVVELPVPVSNQVVVNHNAAVTQLETALEEHRPVGLVLADRAVGRAVVVHMGAIVEDARLEAEGPSVTSADHASPRTRAESSAEAHVHQHHKRTAELAFEVFQRRHVHRVVLGSPADLAPALEAALHPYLRERLGGTVAVGPSAAPDAVLRAALEAESRLERQAEAQLVARLRDAANGGGRGVAGLKAVLGALNERRVETLLVSAGYEAEGWRCGCGHLAVMGRTCAVCGREMELIEDILEDAVDEAFNQSARVEVCHDNADLDVLGRVGALLRY